MSHEQSWIVRVLILLLGCAAALPASAEGGGFSFSSPERYSYPREPQYSYSNEPQYQYPSNSGAQRKCPKGQALFQGRCRIMPVR